MKKLLIAAIAASIASGAWALQSDREQQIEVHADQFNGDEVKQTAVYSGAVVVDQGSMRLTGDVLELRITPKGYRQATITGAPARFRQQRDPDAQNPVDACGSEAHCLRRRDRQGDAHGRRQTLTFGKRR